MNNSKPTKIIGMIHIKGENDAEWEEFKSKQTPTNNDKDRFGPGYGSLGLPNLY
jgi:hypothetical protein